MTESLHSMLVDKIDSVRAELSDRMDRQESKLDLIQQWMTAHPQCPAPGSCVTLSSALQAQTLRVERLELRILSIEKWQNKVIGMGSVLFVILTLFGPSIRRLLRLE